MITEYFERAPRKNRSNIDILMPYASTLIEQGLLDQAEKIVRQLELTGSPNSLNVVDLRKRLRSKKAMLSEADQNDSLNATS